MPRRPGEAGSPQGLPATEGGEAFSETVLPPPSGKIALQAREFSGVNPKGERHPSADPEKRGANPSPPEQSEGNPYLPRVVLRKVPGVRVAALGKAKQPEGEAGKPLKERVDGPGMGFPRSERAKGGGDWPPPREARLVGRTAREASLSVSCFHRNGAGL